MNQRIRQLAEQAGYSKDYLEIGLPSNMEKFAELIVRECASIASGTAVENPPNDLFYGYNLGVNKTAEKIKKHFGVEE
jgi:hypothetical protein